MTEPRTVALFHTENWDNAVVWLRVRAPAAALGWRVCEGNLWQDGRLSQFWPEAVDRADYVIIQREFPRFTEAFNVVLQRAREARKPVIYELDDLLLELPRDHPGWRYHIRSRIGILRAVLEADAVVVSTQPLAEHLQPFNPAVHVWPNCWDESLWPLLAPPERPLGRPLVIGYAGTHTHMHDVAPLGPVLARLLERHTGRVAICFLGGTPPPAPIRGLPNVEWQQFVRLVYADYARLMASARFDVVVIPLRDDSFNRCKSAIKYLEFAALGVAGVYSRLLPYSAVVSPDQTGYLATEPAEWEAALEVLMTQPEQRLALARSAQADLVARWRLADHAPGWASILNSATLREPRPGVEALRRAEGWMNDMAADLEAQLLDTQSALSIASLSWWQKLRCWLGLSR